jgi:hypothetical protein
MLVDLELTQVGELTALGVPARVVAQQVLDGAQTQAGLEGLGRARPQHPGEPIGESQLGHPGHSTPRINGQNGCPPS